MSMVHKWSRMVISCTLCLLGHPALKSLSCQEADPSAIMAAKEVSPPHSHPAIVVRLAKKLRAE